MADDSPLKSGVQSVERAFELLEIMASSGGSMPLGELAARAELPQPTIHRLVRTLLSIHGMFSPRRIISWRHSSEAHSSSVFGKANPSRDASWYIVPSIGTGV